MKKSILITLLVIVSCKTPTQPTPLTATIYGHQKGWEIEVTQIKDSSSAEVSRLIEPGKVYQTKGSIGKHPLALTGIEATITHENNEVILNIDSLLFVCYEEWEDCIP